MGCCLSDVRFVPDSDIEWNCLPNLFQAAA
jgi:hypothetical protein